MKFGKSLAAFVLTLALLTAATAFAQMGDGDCDRDSWCVNPDTLAIVTVKGVVSIDTTLATNPVYFLDEDGDALVDYQLNFGPYWYAPDSSVALRPNDGDVVTITGGFHPDGKYDSPVVVVYEINGEFWRDPFTPFWNNMGGGMGRGDMDGKGHHMRMMNDSLETIEIEGTVLVDSTLMPMFYLDETADGIADYILNFGPPWYEPESGAVRPDSGDVVSLVCGLGRRNAHQLPVLVVYELNGLIWRDSSKFGPHGGGDWIQAQMQQKKRIHNPYDEEDWMEFTPGWNKDQGGGHGGGMHEDSLFCQLNEVYPQNAPKHDKSIVAAYQIGIFNEDGQSKMMQSGHMSKMSFGQNVRFQLRYSDKQASEFDEGALTALAWDDGSESWQQIENVTVNPDENSVTFESADVSSYIILSSAMTTTVAEEIVTAASFELQQNYPNPFNPTTTIEFSLLQNSQVTLSVYNVIGRHVATLANGALDAGVHHVSFNADGLNSGVYFYEIRVGELSKIGSMNLIK